MTRIIYPDIIIKELVNHVDIYTTLRKKHNGKWYFWDFKETAYIGILDDFTEQENFNAIQSALSRLHKNVYITLIAGIVTPKLSYVENGVTRYFFEKDKDQINEKERVLKLS